VASTIDVLECVQRTSTTPTMTSYDLAAKAVPPQKSILTDSKFLESLRAPAFAAAVHM
jgi:hypothetical protein